VQLDQVDRKDMEDVLQIGPSNIQEDKHILSEENKSIEEEKELSENELIEERIKNARKLSLEECLFCLLKSQDLHSNLNHMTFEHGFFIPDIEYMQDLSGFIQYLSEKVSIGNVCLYCNGKGRDFRTLEAVQAHMRDSNHCKLLYEDNEDEYSEYYDFSIDWTDIPKEENQDETSLRSNVTVSEDGCELIFHDGKAVGHRSLQIFYRQKFRPTETRDSVIINSLVNQYRAIGWTDKWHQSAFAKKDQKTQKELASMSMKLGVKSNSLQKHLRKQIL